MSSFWSISSSCVLTFLTSSTDSRGFFFDCFPSTSTFTRFVDWLREFELVKQFESDQSTILLLPVFLSVLFEEEFWMCSTNSLFSSCEFDWWHLSCNDSGEMVSSLNEKDLCCLGVEGSFTNSFSLLSVASSRQAIWSKITSPTFLSTAWDVFSYCTVLFWLFLAACNSCW